MMYYAHGIQTECEAKEPHLLPAHAILRHGDGSVSWHGLPGDAYLVTGEGPGGARLPPTPIRSWSGARQVQVWRGAYWLLRGGRKIKLIEVTPWLDN